MILKVKELEKLLLKHGFTTDRRGNGSTHKKFRRGIYRFILTAKGGAKDADPMQVRDFYRLLEKIKQDAKTI